MLLFCEPMDVFPHGLLIKNWIKSTESDKVIQLEEDHAAEPRVTRSKKATINMERLGELLEVQDDNPTVINHSK